MTKLHQGLKDFKTNDYIKHKQLFKDLKSGQTPHTLFIGCSDSRVVPNLITKTLPGEIFVIRNIANFIPPFRTPDEYLSTVSAIEYAIAILNVENIVICGHSNCGGCNALFYNESDFINIPNVKKWLTLGKNVKEKTLSYLKNRNFLEKSRITEMINVITQINNIKEYPFIIKKIKQQALKIYGWYYDIESGNVFQYYEDKQLFGLIC
jgi:carbonic anhydrase